MIDVFGGSAASLEWGLGVGGGVFLASATAAWASVSLRSNTDQRLRQRVDLAFVALEERARETFKRLRDDIDILYPTGVTHFDPSTAFNDPSSLGASAKKGVAILKMRSTIQRRLERMLGVCSWLRNGWITFTALVLAATLMYFFQFDNKILWGGCAGLAILVCVVTLVGAAVYAWLEAAIQRAVETSQEVAGP